MLSSTEEGSYTHRGDPGEASYGTKTPRVSVTDEEAAILAELAAGRDALEIGTGIAVSTKAIASTARGLVTVDNDPWVHDAIWPLLSGLANVACVADVPTSGQFGFIFIDGDHRTGSVKRDIESARAICAPDGIVVFHDVNYDSVISAVKATCKAVEIRKTAHGLGIVRAADL